MVETEVTEVNGQKFVDIMLEDGNWYGYGVDEETGEELSIRGAWQPAEGGGDYRCYALFNEDGSVYDYAYVYYSVEDARWTMSLASSGDVYG